MKRAAVLVCVLTLASGCLSRSHVIPKRDLLALSQMPPDQRGQSVRVIQGFASEDDPPEARGSSGGTTVVVVGGGGGGGRHHSSAPARRSPNTAKANADKAYVWIILAAAVAITAAATEGARYDGWVQLDPQHPVHLWGPYNEYTWVPLAELDPQTAMWARKAIVRPGEGPFNRLGRAPLNRRGFAYGMTLGRTESPSVLGGPERAGFLSHIQLGVFFTKQVGLLLDFGLGWATNSVDATIFEARNALELQILPLSAGKFHAGGYGQIGIGLRQEDGPKEVARRDTYFAGGGILQLELTTRLAITARAGVTSIFGGTVSDLGLGLSIY